MIRSLSLWDFRGVTLEGIVLSGKDAIIGANGSGKTHILEAIERIGGKSGGKTSKRESLEYTLSLGFDHPLGMKLYTYQKSGKTSIYTIDGVKITGKKFLESLPFRAVSLGPFDMNLLYFAPGERREYIDHILERIYPQFRITKREYEESMRQRNALLKKIREGIAKREDLNYWDATFAKKAEQYSLYRDQWKRAILHEFYRIKSYLPRYDIEFTYMSTIDESSDREGYICEYLKSHRERDILTGHTHIGPHLDDFDCTIKEDAITYSASEFLSRGEMKMLLLGLKEIEIETLRRVLHIPIVLLFDDVFAELDAHHASMIIENCKVEQVILTSQKELPNEGKWRDFSCINLSPA